MSNLLEICTAVLEESGQFAVPETIVGNTDPTAVQLKALANRVGKTLASDYDWQILLTNYTFDTVSGTDDYALPTDYGHFSNLTFWNRDNYTPVRGPVTAMQWQALQSGQLAGASTFYQAFRIVADRFLIYPEPTAAETIAYYYYSKNWITGKSAFSADTDVPLLDNDLFVLGLKWRWLQAKGDSFENEKIEYMERLNSLIALDGGKDAIRFGTVGDPTLFPGNLPEFGFGA